MFPEAYIELLGKGTGGTKAQFIACLGGRISSGWWERVEDLCTFHLLFGDYLKARYDAIVKDSGESADFINGSLRGLCNTKLKLRNRKGGAVRFLVDQSRVIRTLV